METKKSKLVDGLTIETTQRVSNYKYNTDRHVALSELNRHTRQCRKERIKEVLKDVVFYVLPYLVAMILIFSIMSMRG